MSVAKSILRIRNDRRMTQADVARKAGLATSYVSRIENGHVQPTTATLARLAKALGVPPSAFFQSPNQVAGAYRHRCPVSTSGQCIGEQIRSVHGRQPTRGEASYGRRELELLRMADYVILHGSSEVRRALGVVLESLVQREGRTS